MSIDYYNLKNLLIEYNKITEEQLNIELNAKPITDVILFGKIKGEASRPSNILDNVKIDENDCFIILDLFGFKLSSSFSSIISDNTILDNDDNFYMSKGEVVTLIRKSDITDKICKIYGNLRLGKRKVSEAYLALLNYTKVDLHNNGKLSWTIKPCRVELARPNTLSNIMGNCSQYLNKTIELGIIQHPTYLDDMPYIACSNSQLTNGSVLSNFGKEPEQTETNTYVNTAYSTNKKQECRDTLKEPNQMYQNLQDSLQKAESDKVEFLKGLKSQYILVDEVPQCVRYMFDMLQYNMKRNQKYSGGTAGKTILRKYLSNFENYNKKILNNIDATDFIIENFAEIKEHLLDNGFLLETNKVVYALCKSALNDYRQAYMGILGQIVGIPFEDIREIISKCEAYGIDVVKVTSQNPYLLQIFANIPFKTLDKLGLIFGVALKAETEKYRNIALLNDYILSNDNSSTLFFEKDIDSNNLGIKISSTLYTKYEQNNSIFSIAATKSIYTYINDKATLMYPRGHLQYNNLNYREHISIQDLRNIIEEYISSGLGIKEGNYITSSVLCRKELDVAYRLSELARTEFAYDDNEIDRYIKEYEEQVGFELEERQRQAVHLLKHSAFLVTGGAGSGKTTVSNCIVYVLSKLEPDLNIEFAAPTGKAAKRMQEVVKKPVSTLHSKFKIGIDLDDEEFAKSSEGTTAYFFDEGAMISLDLMYSVLKRIDIETCRLFLFGDVNQLPPIGKGLPFKNALDFMPCVYLNVSKRASDASLITRNAKYIVESSNNDLECGDDFYILSCNDNSISDAISLLCKYFLGKASDIEQDTLKKALKTDKLPYINNLSADDIQIVSPITNPKYRWGCTVLNPILKKQFNPNTTPQNSFIFNDIIYSIGDRVIHTNKNCYNIQWYSSHQDGKYQKIWGRGICNGEVGKIVGIYKSSNCEFYNQVDFMSIDYEDKPVRNDDRTNDNYAYDVVVEFWDYISQQYFYIIYQAKLKAEENNIGLSLYGDDLINLQLFYAGTTHKMQGSQAKVIICSLGSYNMYGNFISKEMLYTMVTRASDLVILIGSVSNDYTSTFSKGRGISATNNVITIGEEIFK